MLIERPELWLSALVGAFVLPPGVWLWLLALAAWQIKILSDRAGNRRSAGWLFAAGFASMPAVPLVAPGGRVTVPERTVAVPLVQV